MMTRRHAAKTMALATFTGWVGNPWRNVSAQTNPGPTSPPPTEPARPAPAPLQPGDHQRKLTVGGLERTYLVHIPKDHDPKTPAAVILALHGAAMNGPLMAQFCGLSETSDRAGFIVVYPSGTGTGPFLTWNAGNFRGEMAKGRPDDVAFISRVIDDLGALAKIDSHRIFACGISNGGMMSYRLAAELSERIAAIGPVAGTIAIDESKPQRPVPVIHFHGTKDGFVPFEMPAGKAPAFMRLRGVAESVATWVKINGCAETPVIDTLSKPGDALKVTRETHGGGREGAEVVLVVIEGGGHTWPGMVPIVGFIGQSALNISANDLLWEFFQKHPLP